MEEQRQKLEEGKERDMCLAQGHGQGSLFRITSRACIKSEVLTVCEKKRKDSALFSVVQHFTFVNMPVLTPTVTSSLPETCCFLRPKFTLLEGGGGGFKEWETETH